MALFEWRDEYATGIDIVDMQHKRLVAMLNQLHQSMKEHNADDALAGLLDDLIEYTQTHFTDEEALMRECGYVGYDAHKVSHDDLVGKCVALRAELQASSPSQRVLLSVKVMEFLRDWLHFHILESDQLFVPTVMAAGPVAVAAGDVAGTNG